MIKTNLHADLNKTLTQLVQLVSTVDQEELNTIPFEGSWTIGQVTQHLVMSMSAFLKILHGPLIETPRAPDEFVEKIKAIFLNFNTKMNPPHFVVPHDIYYKKRELADSLESTKSSMLEAVVTLDLTKTCASFEFPGIGFLTRLEAINFILFHTQRHIHQLNKICQILNKKEYEK